MAIREEIQKRIDKKTAEIAGLEAQLRDAGVYLQALEDTLRILPRDTAASDLGQDRVLRPGSNMDKTREAIRSAGRPLHVVELLKAIGKENTHDNRAALSGSLSSYARRGEIFTRPAPNTFGLVELSVASAPAPVTRNGHIDGPPPGFGAADSPATEDQLEDYGDGKEENDVPF